MPGLQLMDTTIRDGQQSLWATRMSLGDMLPILPKMDKVGYWAVEAWGGATFDTCLRFLDENPWERLRSIKAHMPNTDLAMLSRGQNLVGYKHYSKDIVNRFIACAKKDGIQVFRVFDALNDIRNVVDNAEAIKACGGWFEGAISYTVSPVHTLDGFLEYAQKLGRRLHRHQRHGGLAYSVSHRAPGEGVQRRNRSACARAYALCWRHGPHEYHQSGRSGRGHLRHRECAACVRQLSSRGRDDRCCSAGKPLRHGL